jgi:hypothetical protein
MAEPVETRHFFPNLKRNETQTSSGSKVVSYTTDLGPEKPIMMLIHGYPQSSTNGVLSEIFLAYQK